MKRRKQAITLILTIFHAYLYTYLNAMSWKCDFVFFFSSHFLCVGQKVSQNNVSIVRGTYTVRKCAIPTTDISGQPCLMCICCNRFHSCFNFIVGFSDYSFNCTSHSYPYYLYARYRPLYRFALFIPFWIWSVTEIYISSWAFHCMTMTFLFNFVANHRSSAFIHVCISIWNQHGIARSMRTALSPILTIWLT